MENNDKIIIDPLNAVSLYLELYFDQTFLSSATGFIVYKANKNYLITNWHVLSGRNSITKKVLSSHGGIPNKIQIHYHDKNDLTIRHSITEELYNNDAPIIMRQTGTFITSEEKIILGGGIRDKFLGIYSGRIHSDSEIGIVWKPIVIHEILNT